MNRLFICSPDKEKYSQLIDNEKLPNLYLVDNAEEANIILGEPNLIAPHIESAKKLQWVQSTFAGCDSLIAKTKQDYQLTNVRGVFGPLMSEYVFGYLLSATRHFLHNEKMQAMQNWSPLPYQSLSGKKITILGTGSIGQHIAKTAKHFGMQTLGVSHSGNKVEYFDQVLSSTDLETALATAQVIVSVLPATQQTTGLFNKKTFAYCHQALFFNVGRGSVLLEEDLLWAIEQKHIQHAFLDVFIKEPLVKDHPFWTNKAITVTPHNSAKSFPASVFGIFANNYQRFLQGQPLHYIVDFQKGY